MKKQTAKTWYVVWDGTYTYLSCNPDDQYRGDAYPTFAAAKRDVLKYFRDRVEDNRGALKWAREWKKGDSV